jgi:formate hydrogenlyase subunit 3/multisubunit Na+/H+ antiporter MnhD subunit
MTICIIVRIIAIEKRRSATYRVRLKKRRKPYLRYLWLDLNKIKTGINHFFLTQNILNCFYSAFELTRYVTYKIRFLYKTRHQ